MKEMSDSASQGDLQGIWFWAGVYAFLVCGYSIFYQIRVRRWPSTIGLLNHATGAKFSGFEKSPSEQNYHADASYTYHIQGNEYSGYRVSPWVMLVSYNLRVLLDFQLKRIQSSESGEVKVFFNPNMPKKSFLVLPSRGGVVFTLLLGLFPAIGYLFRYHT